MFRSALESIAAAFTFHNQSSRWIDSVLPIVRRVAV